MKKVLSTSLLALTLSTLACGGGNAVSNEKSGAAQHVQQSTAQLQSLFPEHATSMLSESRSPEFDGKAELLLNRADSSGSGSTTQRKASCNGDLDGVYCCCFWDGPVWGCYCT